MPHQPTKTHSMKYMIAMCVIACLFSCSRRVSAPVNVNGNTLLLGKISVRQLEQAPFSAWYSNGYAAYAPDAAVTDSFIPLVKNYRFEIFLGTWCGDSKREVPRLMKVLDDLHVSHSNITIIALGNGDTLYKQSPAHEERGKAIYRVPHLNIYRNGKETGRITETPVKSWEHDLLAILSGRPYTPVHASLQQAGRLIESTLQQNPSVQPEELLQPMRSLPVASGQLLNSYGYVRLYANDMRAALLAFKVNALLFPDAWYTYNALATYYRLQGNKVEEQQWLQLAQQKKAAGGQ